MSRRSIGIAAGMALLCLLCTANVRADEVAEPEPAPAADPVPASAPADAPLVLVSRIGSVFATTFLRPPIEVEAPLAKAGARPESEAPLRFALGRITPNPVARSARIGFDIPVPSRLRLEFLDVTGRVVSSLADGPIGPGRHTREWNGTDRSGRPLAPGVYFLRMEARAAQGTDGLMRVEKVLLLR